jgi:hypothetical protein
VITGARTGNFPVDIVGLDGDIVAAVPRGDRSSVGRVENCVKAWVWFA